MARVTPISVVYTILLFLAVIMLTLPAINYYANPLGASLNSTYTTLNMNFTRTIYAPTDYYTYNSSSGLKASGSLQTFTGLAFMFGAMYQVATAASNGVPMIQVMLGAVAQYAPLPGVEIFALLGLLVMGAEFLLIYFYIASWTKVEA